VAVTAALALALALAARPDAASEPRPAPRDGAAAKAEDARDADLVHHLDELLQLELLENLDLFDPGADDAPQREAAGNNHEPPPAR
jgi:hypothetical protein